MLFRETIAVCCQNHTGYGTQRYNVGAECSFSGTFSDHWALNGK
jgi:hypothetical protein